MLNEVNINVPESNKTVEVNSTVTLSQLPSCVIWQLLCFLDTDSIVSLAGVNTTLRQLVMSRFSLSVSVPFTSSFSSHLLANPYSHNKPVLRMRISKLTSSNWTRCSNQAQCTTFPSAVSCCC